MSVNHEWISRDVSITVEVIKFDIDLDQAEGPDATSPRGAGPSNGAAGVAFVRLVSLV